MGAPGIRASRPLLGVLLALGLVSGLSAGCSSVEGSLLVIEVDAAPALSVGELATTVIAGGRSVVFGVSVPGGTLPPALRIGVELPPGIGGEVEVIVEAAALRATGRTGIVEGQRFDLHLELLAGGLHDLGSDQGSSDLAGADLAGTGQTDAGTIADLRPDKKCGNAVLDTGEQCDDGNLLNADSCEANCTLPFCGNNIVDPGEFCDDGNTVTGDTCSAICTFCGNGLIDLAEECDDRNLVNGDGCSSVCTAEPPPPDPGGGGN